LRFGRKGREREIIQLRWREFQELETSMVYYPRRLWNMEHVCFSLSWPIITTHPNSGLNYNQFQKHDKYFCHSPKIGEAQTYCGLTKLIDEPNIQPGTDE